MPDIEAMQSTETWRYKYTSNLVLRIYAHETFQTSEGEIWYEGNPFNGSSKHFYEWALDLNGDKLSIPTISLPTTEDSPTVADPRLSAYVYAGKKRLFPHLLGFAVPVTLAVLRWEDLQNHRDARRGPRPTPGLYEADVVENMVARHLGDRTVASINNIGMAMSSHPAIDPMVPVHVSVTHPLWAALENGDGLVGARGQAPLVPSVAGARVTVDSALVTAASIIVAFSQSNGVIGSLRVPVENIVPGVSFDIVSTNPVDEGTVGWIQLN